MHRTLPVKCLFHNWNKMTCKCSSVQRIVFLENLAVRRRHSANIKFLNLLSLRSIVPNHYLVYYLMSLAIVLISLSPHIQVPFSSTNYDLNSHIIRLMQVLILSYIFHISQLSSYIIYILIISIKLPHNIIINTYCQS